MTRPPRRPRFFRPDRPAGAAAERRNAASRTRSSPPVSGLEIDRLSAEGRGIGFLPAQQGVSATPVFVAGALPGERVTARITRRTRQIAEADLVAVERASAARQEAPCPLFDRCGGCQLQMLAIDAQLAHKEQVLRQLLAPFAVEAWVAPLTAAAWRYRHRARFAVTPGVDGQPSIGFRAAGSRAVVPVDACPVLDARLEQMVPLLPRWLAALDHWRRIEELLVAVDAHGRVGLSWRASPALSRRDAERLTALASAAGVAVDPDDLLYPVALAPGCDGGRLATPAGQQPQPSSDQLAAAGYHFRLTDFTQVNPAVNRLLVAQVRSWLQPTPGDLIADYFCGLGNFALALATPDITVVGIEVVTEMVERAAANAQRLGLGEQVRFEMADLFTDPRVPVGATKALLDPPRAGARALCEQLARTALEWIVYVSCNPQTLQRDLRILVEGGYRVRRAGLADMFPHTGHSEAVVLLTR